MIGAAVRVPAGWPLVAHDGGEFCWYGHVFHQVCFAAVQDGLDDGLVGEVFVACLGATWLTYVVRNQPGSGWRVTGTTGSMAVA